MTMHYRTLAVLALSLALAVAAAQSVATTDCEIRKLAWAFAKKQLPEKKELPAVFDALEISRRCGTERPQFVEEELRARGPRLDMPRDYTVFVDGNRGNDNNPATFDQPVKTLQRGLELTRSSPAFLIVLRGARYFLPSTIELNTRDNGLTITCYFNETCTLSGGQMLSLTWKPFRDGIFVADVPRGLSFTSLFVNGRRAIRARFPNANPETSGLHTHPTGYVPSAQAWAKPTVKPDAQEIHIDFPVRNGTHFPTFQIGIGGPVEQFTPPESYWGTKDPVGGGGSTYAVPSGLQWNPATFSSKKWSNPKTGIVHAFHEGHWGNWMFAIDSVEQNTRTIQWTKGGFQEARGSHKGSEFYVENIFEELDSKNEWFLDDDKALLYFWPNSTDGRPENAEYIVPQLETIFAVRGSQAAPVTDLRIAGFTFMHTTTTYMSDYEVPSGGDWSVHRNGAVFAEGVVRFMLDHNLFDGPGGNAVVISRFARGVTIANNEFVWVGDSAIVLLGSSNLIDGTDGNQPMNTLVANNLVREIGIFGKQTSPLFQALTALTTVTGNVFFNMPRAGINFNDGFGGGHDVSYNLLFNTVRETSDHVSSSAKPGTSVFLQGPFNSWDRQPYVTRVRDGTPQLTPKESFLHHNFLINNYNAVWPIDHDDGSCYFTDYLNYLVYGGFKNYLGHSKTARNNYYIHPDVAVASGDGKPIPGVFPKMPFCANSDGAKRGSSGWGDSWTSNVCAMSSSVSVYSYGGCNAADLKDLIPFTANNTFYTTGNVQIKCGARVLSLAEFAQLGYDVGSVRLPAASTEQIIAWGKALFAL